MRAVIYARFSSDNQNDRSIDDQVRLCRDHVARLGGDVIEVYTDYALSGAHLASRPAAVRMLEDAKGHDRKFDTIVAEALDRLSRDQEHVAGLFKRLRFAGVQIVTVAEGKVDELHIGLKGTMNALFLKDLAAKIRRGQSGRAAQGFVTGGLSYGYDVVRQFDAKGEPVRGLRAVNPEKATIVRRIFEAYVIGEAPRAIAAQLNRDGVPPPRGGIWRASTINGNHARGDGILSNEIYRGRLVWNRQRMVRDPETGRRLPRVNADSERIVTEVPDLRIVSDALWEAAQAIKARYALSRGRRLRRPKRLFSGLVRCGCCGGAYVIKQSGRMACATHRDAGTCDNNRTIPVAAVEERVLTGVRDCLLMPEAIDEFMEAYRDERARLSDSRLTRRAELTRKLEQLDRQLGNLIDAIAEGIASAEMRKRVAGLEAERDDARTEIAAIDRAASTVVTLHGDAIAAWRRLVDRVSDEIAMAPANDRVGPITAIRNLIERIEVSPGERRGETKVIGVSNVHALLEGPSVSPSQSGRVIQMVAAEGSHHYHQTIRFACQPRKSAINDKGPPQLSPERPLSRQHAAGGSRYLMVPDGT